MEAPQFLKCRVYDCAYNADNLCRAIAVTIGDGGRPRCGTFHRFVMKAKGLHADCTATIGACRISSCIHNVALRCRLPEILVGYRQQEPQCLTFQSTAAADMDDHGVCSDERNAALHSQVPEIFIG